MNMRKIMLLTTSYTGHGHKSISTAISDHLLKYDDIVINEVESFALIGRIGEDISRLYGPVTRNVSELWRLIFSLSNKSGATVANIMALLIHDRFLKLIESDRPDLILTVHPMFNGSIANLLEYYNLPIPIIAMQADIISIHSTWCDPRATITLCPTQEAYDTSIETGMPPSKMRVTGFPVRSRVCEAARTYDRTDYDGTRPLKCLVMSGGEGSGNLREYAEVLLDRFGADVTIICGRNEKMRKALSERLEEYGNMAHVLGFVENPQDYMLSSDLMIARGSPNTIMEAVTCNVPLVITGALPGQEQGNPGFVESHALGVLCDSPDTLGDAVDRLIRNDLAKYRAIKQAQREYRSFDSAKDIATIVESMVTPISYDAPKYKLKHSLK